MAEAPHPLVGLIASWINIEDEDGWYRPAGRGKVIAALPRSDDLLVVENIPRGTDDDEPTHMLIVSTTEPGITFYPTLEAEDAHYRWLMADPKRVVELVPPPKPKPPTRRR